jgi:hypothetical protein
MINQSQVNQITKIMEMTDTSLGMSDTHADMGYTDDVQYGIIPGQNDNGFHANDYLLARQLLTQVGSMERLRELLDNLEQVIDTLDLAGDKHVEQIARFCEDDVC